MGHDAGNLVLVDCGKALKKCLRTSDLSCRLGGGECVKVHLFYENKLIIMN
ncbi:diguanylate cyclase domain-containing protein [Pleionea sp. CnH1-48]|uniref:diguanylate cyclase domain-containing protein n=1 Tax=Pleionea sp. CnH1-48 TaxID=2954494 RepID=UPI00353099C5